MTAPEPIAEPPLFKPRHGLTPERVAWLAKHNITIRTDGWATNKARPSKGIIEKRDKCGEVSTRVMERARKLGRFTHKGLSEEAKCTKGQAKNAIRRMIDRGELKSLAHETKAGGLMIYQIKEAAKVKP